MKIQKLKIDGYKNLDLTLDHRSDLIAVIGNNGSGKSNLLESLSLIFKSLYNDGESVPFDYSIEYKFEDKDIIKIEKSKSKITFRKNDEPLVSIKEYLPKKLVAIYSGEEDRLWRRCYQPFYNQFIREINDPRRRISGYLQTPQMLYLDKTYWHISLLSLAVPDSVADGDLIKERNEDFIKNTLSIEKIDKVKFDFEDKSKYESYSNNPTLEFIRAIDNKSEYTIDELKEIFEREGYIADDVYKHLYLALTPEGSKIIRDIKIIFNQHLTVEDLSEGEKKLLLMKAAFEFAGQNDSLFILDEPDSHVHLNNKELIVKTFEPYKKNRQIILTTHSPTITQCIDEDELYMIDKGQIISRKKQETISHLTDDFWNKHQQNIFLSSTKEIILLVEGRHDKMHIENAFNKLRDEYENLTFEIFSFGGESKIQPFMNGLYEAGIKKEVIYIAVYDNDSAGTASLNKFDPEVQNCGYRKLKKDKLDHNNFFAFALTKPEDFTSDCTIESMYSPEKYEEALRTAFEQSIGHFTNQSIESINKSIKDGSKNILADNSKSYEKEDFKNFRLLFDLILKIKKDCSKGKVSVSKKQINNFHKEKNTFSENRQRPNDENEIFYFKGKNIDAKGKYDDEKKIFTIFKGSVIAKECKDSYKQKNKAERTSKINLIKRQEKDSSYILEEDITGFKSPSGASDFVNGGSSNGWSVWKNIKGKSLDEVYRKKS